MRLDESIVLERPTEVPDGFGGVEVGWETAKATRANFRYLRGGESVQSARLEGRQPAVVTVRLDAITSLTTPAWRIRDARRSDVYDIKAAVPSSDRLYLEITAVRREQATA